MTHIEDPERISSHNPFIVPIETYESPASRIRGFKELFEYGLNAPSPMLVLGHNAFDEYLINGKLTPALEEAIGDAFDAIRKANPSRGAYVGRAFYVPGIDNPNGPRTAGITDKAEYLKEVENFYRFVIAHSYDNVAGADIALILHPFLKATDPRDSYGDIPINQQEILPWSGGVVVPHSEPGREHQVKIVATFGSDEAVKSYPSDTYIVDPQRGTIQNKQIAIKNETTVPTSGSKYDEHFPIPSRFQTEQALTDREILMVAAEAEKVFSRRPLARLEFLVQKDGVYVREIAQWEPEDDMDLLRLGPNETITSHIVHIESASDISKIKGPDAIVYFSPQTYRERTTDIFAQVTHIPGNQRLVALCWGEITTGHAVKVLSEAGFSVIFVGDKNFPDGLEVKISRGKDNAAIIEPLDRYYDAIVPLKEVQRLSRGEAGQKIGRLALMLSAGLPVPDGFAISSEAIKRYLGDIEISQYIAQLDTIDITDKTKLTELTALVQNKIRTTDLPKSLEQQILSALDHYGYAAYAVRSTGSEDGAGKSRAGLYQSEINVSPGEIVQALKRTIASYYSPTSIAEIITSGELPSEITVGVGIHNYVPAEAGSLGAVAFTFRNQVVIETTNGSTESIVSGTATDYLKITVDRKSGAVEVQPHGNTRQTISDKTIQEAVAMVYEVEKLFKSYQDVEFLIQPDGSIYIFQARPR